MGAFPDGLNEQVGHEFAASQQYVAIAVHYDAQTLPRLAAHFYRQAVEERNHAMMIVQYLLDADERVLIPGVAAPQTEFADVVEPVRLALEQEKRVTAADLRPAKLARSEGDLVGEQFLHWFLQEQREEVSSMGALLDGRRALARQRDADRGLPRARDGRRRRRSTPARLRPRAARSSARLGGSRDRGADVLRDRFQLDRRAGDVLEQLVRGRPLPERPQLGQERARPRGA